MESIYVMLGLYAGILIYYGLSKKHHVVIKHEVKNISQTK